MNDVITLFLCGDVMTGRGIDQALPHPAPPDLYEPWVQDAREYVSLAEAANGEFPKPMAPAHIWGDALAELAHFRPHLRLINLETGITRHGTPWPDKGIHYRMSPENAACLQAARIDCCSLANNHVMDWGVDALRETCRVLDGLGIAHAGAGEDLGAAMKPARLDVTTGHRVWVFSLGMTDSGIPPEWHAARGRPGVWLATEASAAGAEPVAERIRAHKRPGDLAVVSVHWGSNWGYRIPKGHREFAYRLVEAGADLIHGHSSHHPVGMELYRGRPILYGCGDFINDYEGIRGYEIVQPDLTLMFFPAFDAATGVLRSMSMTPLRRARFSLHRTGKDDARWLCEMLNRERQGDDPEFRLDDAGRIQWDLAQ